ncbi:hypothetical protein DOTSEDRAFT_162315 [Dothistroma septosporum NZE10]|uniref:Tetraspanin Tsp3 n=1 Tax=Dothistroma septosporum (strain NZE10 / CBS 128990) TaxID=675120 RepID=N1Q2G7_DOTSN|nr:hypothetical protein DOTSEDRAFT_162315 [Dothistroma septosporum NZE10]
MAKFQLNRRRVMTILSIIYLLTLTILAVYTLHLSNYYSLPIPNVHSALTVALPPLAGIALETLISLQTYYITKSPSHQISATKSLQTTTALFLIYETVLATLAGTHISPLGGLWCPLHDKWTGLFRSKDSTSIARIQDAFSCCGFNGVRDMAFPFPDGTHDSDACVGRYERDTACLEPWRSMERKVAIILLVVPVMVFMWQVALFLTLGGETEGWLPSVVRLPRDGEREVRVRPAITYNDMDEDVIARDGDSLKEEVGRLNRDSRVASHVAGSSGRARPSSLIPEQGAEGDVWARD